ILAENCFACHGQDSNKRQAGLRLDKAEGAVTKLLSGNLAVVAGKPESSALYRRITARGPLVMPPVATGKRLKPEQIAILRRWIAEGGKYAAHWAYIQPKPATPLAVAAYPTPSTQLRIPKWIAGWPRNPIDR